MFPYFQWRLSFQACRPTRFRPVWLRFARALSGGHLLATWKRNRTRPHSVSLWNGWRGLAMGVNCPWLRSQALRKPLLREHFRLDAGLALHPASGPMPGSEPGPEINHSRPTRPAPVQPWLYTNYYTPEAGLREAESGGAPCGERSTWNRPAGRQPAPEVRSGPGCKGTGGRCAKGESGREDLNLRPHPPQGCALPGCATPRFNGW